MLKRLLRETWPGHALSFLPKWIIKRRRLYAFLDDQMRDSGQGQPAVLITGPPRIGKSTVGAAASRAQGLRHVKLDGHTAFISLSPLSKLGARSPGFLRVGNRVLREREGRRLAEHVIARTDGRGLILDAALVRYAVSAAPSDCATWIREGRIVVFSSDASLDERLATIHTHRTTGDCWTSKVSLEGVRYVAERIVQECRMLNDLADRYDFPVQMLDCHDFEASTRAAADRIGRLLSGQGAPRTQAAE